MKTDFYWEASVYWGAYLKNIFLSSALFWNSKLMTTVSWEHSLGPKIKNKKPTTSKNSNCCDQSPEDRSQNASFLFQVVFYLSFFRVMKHWYRTIHSFYLSFSFPFIFFIFLCLCLFLCPCLSLSLFVTLAYLF